MYMYMDMFKDMYVYMYVFATMRTGVPRIKACFLHPDAWFIFNLQRNLFYSEHTYLSGCELAID
jgi:hypothetical protein